ncbi:MAG: tRNA 2-thiouridine(34) synthase MnmA [Eubacteriales bacterium]
MTDNALVGGRPRALVAMSGGVDSSVAARLAAEMGYECVGCTMKLYENEDAALPRGRTCCSLDDTSDARSVAVRLGMPYYVFNFTDDFREKVIGKFVRSYEAGITPNPCIDCNRYMKFGKLYERARVLGCERIVTGHYARIEYDGARYTLKKALDPGKDQSYVLYSMTQEQLSHTLFPLGGMTKSQTRELAHRYGFLNADKPDSQDICFVPDGDYARVIENFSGKRYEPGNFVDSDGNILGRHRGIIHYTVGQRKGLGLSFDEPVYVCAVCAENNTVTLGTRSELMSDTAVTEDFNWISGEVPDAPVRCGVKIRYRQSEQSATAVPLGDGRVRLDFDTPQRAVTPGQAAVLYDGDTVLGGGVIIGAR